MGYDVYDACVVAAETEDDARNIHPLSEWMWVSNGDMWPKNPKDVKVKLIGTAETGINRGVIVASFNAG